ncbi:unnamed protein product [Prunus armeniaca]
MPKLSASHYYSHWGNLLNPPFTAAQPVSCRKKKSPTPYNPGRHWVLLIVRAKKETVYFLDPLPGNRVVNEEAKNMVNSAIKIYNSHIGRQGRKAPIWKTLRGTPKRPSSVECGYYVMRFMRDIIMDPSLEFEKTLNNHCLWIAVCQGKEQAPYPQAAIDEVRNEWAEFVCLHVD